MHHIEIRLLTTMLHRGDFAPLIQGDIAAEHFESDLGKILFGFISGYSQQTDKVARYPSLAVVRSRFDHIELPEPDPGDTVESLLHETLLTRTKSELRKIATDLQSVALSSDNPRDSLPEILGALKRISDKGQRSRHLSLAEAYPTILENYATGEILPDGIPYPWESLNKATKGMHRKEFYVFAGRPKSRKTFIALCIAVHAMKNSHARILVFTPEMPRMQVLLRVIAFLSEVHYFELKNGKLSGAEEMMLIEQARTYAMMSSETENDYQIRLNRSLGLPSGIIPSIDVVESTGRTVSWMESQIEMYRPDIVICDSFYRQAPEGTRKSDADWKAVTYISRALKDLAMSTNTCILGTHQMNRGAEGQIGTLSNMALADAIGQDADVIYRVITQNSQGAGRSALVILGGREVSIDGVFINNEPCFDFTEIGAITNKAAIVKWLEEDDNAAAEEAAKELLHRRGGPSGGKKGAAKKKDETYSKASGNVNAKKAELGNAQTAIDSAT